MTEQMPSEPMTSQPRSEQPTEHNGQKVWAPRGPLWFQTIPLSSTNDGPRMRLGRDNRFNQMAIAFDEKPCEDSRKRLHNDGWKWRQAESQWTKQLEIDHRATGQQDAEKLFEALAKIERRERQLDEQLEAIRR